MGRAKFDHIKRLLTLTSDNIKRLSLYYIHTSKVVLECHYNFSTLFKTIYWTLFLISSFKEIFFPTDLIDLFWSSSHFHSTVSQLKNKVNILSMKKASSHCFRNEKIQYRICFLSVKIYIEVVHIWRHGFRGRDVKDFVTSVLKPS